MIIKIEKILQKRGITKKELSEKTGIRIERVNKLANGETDKIGVEEMEKICSVLDCNVEDLFEE